MTSSVHEFDAREGGEFRISLTYDVPTVGGEGERGDGHVRRPFPRRVPDAEVVQVVEFETDDPELRGEMTITYTLADAHGETDLVGLHENVPPGVSPDENELGWSISIDKLAQLVESKA